MYFCKGFMFASSKRASIAAFFDLSNFRFIPLTPGPSPSSGEGSRKRAHKVGFGLRLKPQASAICRLRRPGKSVRKGRRSRRPVISLGFQPQAPRRPGGADPHPRRL